MELFAAIVAAAVVMGIVDFIWLGFVAKKLYYDEMGSILLKKPNMLPAILFYAVYVVGTVVFVVLPALPDGSWLSVAGMGAFFGLVAYATYDLTNMATLKGFSKKIVVIDLLWGAFITAIVSVFAFFAAVTFG